MLRTTRHPGTNGEDYIETAVRVSKDFSPTPRRDFSVSGGCDKYHKKANLAACASDRDSQIDPKSTLSFPSFPHSVGRVALANEDITNECYHYGKAQSSSSDVNASTTDGIVTDPISSRFAIPSTTARPRRNHHKHRLPSERTTPTAYSPAYRCY